MSWTGGLGWAGRGQFESCDRPDFENMIGRAGPGRADDVAKLMGEAGSRASIQDISRDAPSCGPSSEKWMGRDGPRPIIRKIDGPDRAAAHHPKLLWAEPGRGP